MKLKVVFFIIIICTLSYSFIQSDNDYLKYSCRFLSVDTVSENLVLISALNCHGHDSLNLLMDKSSFNRDSSLVFDNYKTGIYIVEVRKVSNIELRKLFNFRSAEFVVFFENKNLLISDKKAYYSIQSLKKSNF